MAKAISFFTFLMLFLHASMATVYEVGDYEGWTVHDADFYKQWSSYHGNIHVGDSIVFKYVPGSHNAVEVTPEDYQACDISSPRFIASYTSGHDFITFDKSGTYYYICTLPGHCQAGLKVAIEVLDTPNTSPFPGSTTPRNSSSAGSIPTLPGSPNTSPFPGSTTPHNSSSPSGVAAGSIPIPSGVVQTPAGVAAVGNHPPTDYSSNTMQYSATAATMQYSAAQNIRVSLFSTSVMGLIAAGLLLFNAGLKAY